MTIEIASWNVNSVKARLPNLVQWLKEHKPDLVCLQELKCLEEAFPRDEIESLGYNVAIHGQKTYNGVALLSRFPLEDVTRGLPDYTDEQARYIEAIISTQTCALRIASLYLPNGNPVEAVKGGGAKYKYKLEWMAALQAHVENLLTYEEMFVLAGDYNVIPSAADVYNPPAWEADALYRLETRTAWRRLLNLGLTEAVGALVNTGEQTYTFWDYQRGAWPKNNGIRIDHHLLSPLAADRLRGFTIDRDTRGWEKPSDHAPIRITLDL